MSWKVLRGVINKVSNMWNALCFAICYVTKLNRHEKVKIILKNNTVQKCKQSEPY